MPTLQPVILSGGTGSRLWPVSREHYPKQLLALFSEQTLIQDTVSRLEGLDRDTDELTMLPPIVVCNEEHRFFIAEQLRQIDCPPEAIILEPQGRNTAPALTLAALAIAEQDPETIMLVMPADHVILDQASFQASLRHGITQAGQGKLVTFGIEPVSAETGYGYIRKGESVDGNPVACTIDRFVEKPDQSTAESYLASGDYLWNSGMFMMQAGVWNRTIETCAPAIYNAVQQAFAGREDDRDFVRVDKTAFLASPGDSIDYAVMEKLTGESASTTLSPVVVPMSAGWSDIGIWSTLWEVSDKDPEGNVIKGDVYALDNEDCLLFSNQRHIATVGLKETIVVETADAILVADRNRSQDVKQIVDYLKGASRDEYLTHRKVYRPWGNYESIDAATRYQVKRITVAPGSALSLQMHHHRAEHWVVVTGTARVTRGEEEFLVTENESTFIPLGVKHRLENCGSIPLEIIEVQSGSYLGEDDIVRFEDIYGRKK
ncbi:mannose-1-phosphate guanylyltransferase/mannose-6-phosphate isomerase [Thiohalophilus thiocyanatoxydans]|uniref:mannose-1-phosphate guanylyltransferase n=1 Tax=Thiohalophilus thiocyanatoxydans TaxID=381308 RepID=A0A4R8IP34_9GAMM|nr:mannose-1-phosphate guanylyltransferase/mannose-6-phosphate isomerase [Thiohalophilus thiocyanatoxydans]TDY02672.1 mannose-1-phosphate guanylyltransferase (GDP) /mannose-6-phosphate isomerase type 2 [Thiohalophilus thiocyanatoxydans]